MEDYFSMLMLEQILSMNPSDNIKTNMERVAGINSLSACKNSLNDIMTYIDKQ